MPGAPSTSVFARRFAGWRLPRTLHPVAWWLWAICLVVAVTQTTNPLLLALVFVVLGFVVSSRRTEAPWARAFKYYLYVALTVVAIRVVFRSVFGGDVGGPGSHVIFTLPRIPLPAWAAGVQIGGPVTLEGTLSALYSGLKLGCLLCCLGAANALANPKRALRSLPGALYELGVAAVVTFNVGPQLVEGVQRVRRARKLRGGSSQKFHVLRSIAIPVLEDAFDRSLRLAAAMDSRGFGRTDNASRALRRTTGALMIIGLLLMCRRLRADRSVRILAHGTPPSGRRRAGLYRGARRRESTRRSNELPARSVESSGVIGRRNRSGSGGCPPRIFGRESIPDEPPLQPDHVAVAPIGAGDRNCRGRACGNRHSTAAETITNADGGTRR